MSPSPAMKIGVLGAGAIGAHVGVRLAAAGAEVVLVGRAALLDDHRAGRLAARSLAGQRVEPPASLRCTTEVEALAEVELCLVCVKSRDSEAAGHSLARVLAPEAVVVSLQNGLRNQARLRDAGLSDALAGMVGFNVFVAAGEYRQATSGLLMIERSTRAAPTLDRLRALAETARLEFELRDDMPAVQAGKLLLNLNNAICTLAGVSIAESLKTRALRRCYAASMREGIAILEAAGVPIARIGTLPPRFIAKVLPLPDAIVLRVAKSMIAIDPGARSSTLQDLERGRPTEIDALDGELVALAEQHRLPCPVHRWIVEQVHAMEGQSPIEFFSPERLWAAISALEN
ncbi:2-dehydropantoate 2-reductase [Nannocystaceae bacterium ST9]